MEKGKEKHIQKTPFQLIEEACLDNWTTYEGRREGVIYQTNFKQRTPIPISPVPVHRLYFFPTHSPKDINNIWIAALQIAEVVKPPLAERTLGAQSIIIFNCGETLILDVSLNGTEHSNVCLA